MHIIRIHCCVDSDILQLPELKEFIGKEVEILVLEEPPSIAKTTSGREGLVRLIPDCRSGYDRP